MNGGYRQGKKNVMRSIEEKERIFLEYLNWNVGYRSIAMLYNISSSVLRK